MLSKLLLSLKTYSDWIRLFQVFLRQKNYLPKYHHINSNPCNTERTIQLKLKYYLSNIKNEQHPIYPTGKQFFFFFASALVKYRIATNLYKIPKKAQSKMQSSNGTWDPVRPWHGGNLTSLLLWCFQPVIVPVKA